MSLRKAVFLDKDGTLVVDVPFNADPALVTLTRGGGEGLRALASAGFELIVVTNQSGIARGMFGEADLTRVRRRIEELLAEQGVFLSAFYHCPHHPDGSVPGYAVACDCRKPMPGLVLRAAAEHGVDLARSWLIGDILNDVEAGRRAGCRTALLLNGGETEWVRGPLRSPHLTALDLAEAGSAIVSAEADGAKDRKSKVWGCAS